MAHQLLFRLLVFTGLPNKFHDSRKIISPIRGLKEHEDKQYKIYREFIQLHEPEDNTDRDFIPSQKEA